jgi:hypothetical protein
MPGVFRCDRGDDACVFFIFARKAAGASSARHSLRPLMGGKQDVYGKTRADMRRDREAVSCRHCEERSDEAIHSFLALRDGLLRFARNDGHN